MEKRLVFLRIFIQPLFSVPIRKLNKAGEEKASIQLHFILYQDGRKSKKSI
jgi:hypothetical protein